MIAISRSVGTVESTVSQLARPKGRERSAAIGLLAGSGLELPSLAMASSPGGAHDPDRYRPSRSGTWAMLMVVSRSSV